MTSWNRRLSAASATTQRSVFSKADYLEEAVALGVPPDDQAALLALAKLAADREDFRVTIGVRAGSDEALFEVFAGPEGPVARPVGQLNAAAAPGAAPAATPVEPGVSGGIGELPREGEVDITSVLTGTLVQAPDLVAIFASVGHEAIWANDAFVTLIPIREADKIWLVELFDEWSKGHYEVKVLPALVKYGRWRGRLTLKTGDDESLPVSAVVVAHRDQRGEIEAVSMVARDVTEMQLTEGDADETRTRFAALVEHVSDIIAVLSPDGMIEYASPAAARVLGQDEGSLNGTSLLELVHPDDLPGRIVDLARSDEQGIGTPVELRLRAADGSWRHLEVVVSDLTENPAIGGIVMDARDVTERVEAISALATKAYTDQLTGLPNRMRLLDRMAQALQQATREGSVGVLLCDIDHFKAINDTFGQTAADEVLREIADRLVEAAGLGATVARVRSDEFVVLLGDLGDTGDAVRMANRLRAAISAPFEKEGARILVTASVGIAFSRPGEEPESLMREADQALMHSKESGRDRSELFSPALAAKADHRRTVERQLRNRLDDESIVLHYQPIVDLESRKVVSAEALLRVHDSEGALLSPAELIEAAESSGLIAMLGSQVLQMTCDQLAVWGSQSDGPLVSEISVNISPRQLADSELTNRVSNALNVASVPAERLCLEITENMLIGHQATVDASISYLRAIGVKIGLDEFGAGQSSLGYLKRFPLDFVKIDRSLVAGLGKTEQDTAIVRATIDLAHNLDLIVVAVGVENEEQLDALELLGCDRVQGYLFAPPVPADEFVGRSAAVG